MIEREQFKSSADKIAEDLISKKEADDIDLEIFEKPQKKDEEYKEDRGGFIKGKIDGHEVEMEWGPMMDTVAEGLLNDPDPYWKRLSFAETRSGLKVKIDGLEVSYENAEKIIDKYEEFTRKPETKR